MNEASTRMLEAFKVTPTFHERVWGGHDLKASASPIGEAWAVYEGNLVEEGPYAGMTLGQMAALYGADFLGEHAVHLTGARFPLLIKLLDCADWLSLQVHPNDEQAVQLEGPGYFGKTEAWHILKAAPDARLISGLQYCSTREAMTQGIKDGSIIDLVNYMPVKQGDTILTRAGTIHALGPGLLIYEVQQTSDLTYRLYDWNRSQIGGRALHIEQSIVVSEPDGRGYYRPSQSNGDEAQQVLTTCEYFTLELIQSSLMPVCLDTLGLSFHAVTVLEGEVEIEGPGWSSVLGQCETIIVPANCGAYRVYPRRDFRALVASVG